jgi:hypothetical protein
MLLNTGFVFSNISSLMVKSKIDSRNKKSVNLAPTIKVSVPASAPPTPPDTGASTRIACGNKSLAVD